jgi:membrane dipeptidase
MIVVDAHEDIAWNMLSFGRDYTRSAFDIRKSEGGGPTVSRNGNALLGWPEWIDGKVGLIFATLFAPPARRAIGRWEKYIYGDSHEARRIYLQELDAYHRLVEEQAEKFELITTIKELDPLVSRWEADEGVEPKIGFVLLMEGSDAIEDPEELEEWFARGVRIIGPAWSGTRHSGGTYEPGPLTSEGLELLEAMAGFGMILDLSHMAEQATFQALDLYPGVVIASHANARSLLDGSEIPDRHLSDHAIRRIAERDGVVGVVPYNRFLDGDWREGDPRTGVTLDHVTAQVDHICQLVGSASHVGIGSDFDGGFGLEKVPSGIESVADLRLIGEALKPHGYSEDDIRGFLGGNWIRMLRNALPEG